MYLAYFRLTPLGCITLSATNDLIKVLAFSVDMLKQFLTFLLSIYCTCFSPHGDRNSFQLPYYFKTNGKSICYLECFMMIVLCGLQGNQPNSMFIENIWESISCFRQYCSGNIKKNRHWTGYCLHLLGISLSLLYVTQINKRKSVFTIVNCITDLSYSFIQDIANCLG